jgi:hypothetical protein
VVWTGLGLLYDRAELGVPSGVGSVDRPTKPSLVSQSSMHGTPCIGF